MGAERAISVSQSGPAAIRNFNDEIVAKMEMGDGGSWILMGRVSIWNRDGDKQYATAKLVHDANVVIDSVTTYIDYLEGYGFYLQAGFVTEGEETITLECNSYDGQAEYGSIIAFKVDRIDFQ
jgi:hypothetical protein